MTRTTNIREALRMNEGADSHWGPTKTHTILPLWQVQQTYQPLHFLVTVTDLSKTETSFVLFDYSNCKVAQVKLRRVWML